MRTLIAMTLLASLAGCTRWSADQHLNSAYRAYDEGDCQKVVLELSQVDRKTQSRPYIRPESALLRGQCLERQNLFVDAVQTYQWILFQYPGSEYAFRARARLQTLEQTGQYHPAQEAVPRPAAL
ncbi:tetratricopeptide repeat protein [Pseudomonas typographi]|uniref:Tetratricopeptide repeat protein n=1 Tax=Pseudomonas typographi TaxID=2715964 RepID=A0ABR7YXA4_9PSED|nr:tetratricopeptide repeat protein [Pseudomonas typographi]MBD1550933.1 tetratricopeptide repeat protein [Pseudomonas typographi]MBD1585758.1 tetratricopeptide repeat protein [Pseudomonas typographi]MBD1597832.1 tetratricopeptide repeat protein [Pseudomonas typographi]